MVLPLNLRQKKVINIQKQVNSTEGRIMGQTKTKKRKMKQEQQQKVENMSAKEYVNTATREFLSGMAVIAENVQKGEEFGDIQAIVPIKDTHVLVLEVKYVELTEESKNDLRKEREEIEKSMQESSEESNQEELGKFGLSLCPEADETVQS